MKTYTTNKGTQLPIRILQGKEYLEVTYRVLWMREEHPEWGIETEYLKLDETVAIAKATIRDGNGKIIAQGTKTETPKGFADFVEKAETGSVGRALALCGYGTQFAQDLDEGERIVDGPREPKRPALAEAPPADLDSYVIKTGKFAGRKLLDVGAAELRNYYDWCMKERKGNQEELKIFAAYVESRTPKAVSK